MSKLYVVVSGRLELDGDLLLPGQQVLLSDAQAEHPLAKGVVELAPVAMDAGVAAVADGAGAAGAAVRPRGGKAAAAEA